jgi:hypothetical protein
MEQRSFLAKWSKVHVEQGSGQRRKGHVEGVKKVMACEIKLVHIT